MKNSSITLLMMMISICLSFSLFAQPPQKMSYQMVVRDNQNNLVVNQQIGVKISILEQHPNGFPVFSETHQLITNGNGLMTLEIGTGTPAPQNDLTTIDWGDNDFYLQSEIDITGGQQYTITGTQQLITVPYSFYAGASAFADSADFNHLANRPIGQNSGDILYWNATTQTWDLLPIGQQGQILTVNNGTLSWITSTALTTLPPTIRTDSVFDITGRVAKVRATILDAGSTGIIASGICWSTTPNPSLGNNFTTDGTSIGSYVSTATNLTSGVTFYVRAYATNSVGTSYGQPISFTTPTHCGTVTDQDGNVYQTIYVGAQCWMKENLRTTHYSNGAAITKGTKSSYSFGSTKLYFAYNDLEDSVQTYGYLYSWTAAMNGAGSSNNNPSGIQGICPSGWHLPSSAEWCELENYVEPGIDVNCSTIGYRGSMAKKMTLPAYWKSYPSNLFAPGNWHSDTTYCNTSGFSAVPAGYYYGYYSTPTSNYYTDRLETGYWWTCTIRSGSYPYMRGITYSSTGVNLSSYDYYYYAFSVRCIKN